MGDRIAALHRFLKSAGLAADMTDQKNRISRPGPYLRTAAAAAIMLGLAGCGARGPANAAAANGSAPGPAPALAVGEWEVSTVMIPRPGMPLPPAETSRIRVEPEQAFAPTAEFFTLSGGGCTQNNVRVADGRISGSMTCPGQGSFREVRYQVNGSYSLRAFQVTVDAQLSVLAFRQERRGRFLRP
jgi:hypothetical protein